VDDSTLAYVKSVLLLSNVTASLFCFLDLQLIYVLHNMDIADLILNGRRQLLYTLKCNKIGLK